MTVCGDTGLGEKQITPPEQALGKTARHVSDHFYPPFVRFLHGDSKYSVPSYCAFNLNVTVWHLTEGKTNA